MRNGRNRTAGNEGRRDNDERQYAIGRNAAIRRITVLNDQGGGIMNFTVDITATLRAQEHGHQPIVCFETEQ